METTTINIQIKTRDRLKKVGEMGMTYDDVIIMLLDEYEVMKWEKDEREKIKRIKKDVIGN